MTILAEPRVSRSRLTTSPDRAPAFRQRHGENLLQRLASLQLTVWLFACSIVLVLAGTLAQVDRDISQVVDRFFRSFVAYVDFQLFFPPAFFPNGMVVDGGFYFPGGWTLGTLLCVNLLSAHVVRFRIQAHGKQLALGLALLMFGGVITGLVIATGASADGLQAVPWLSWGSVWTLALGILATTSVGLLLFGWRSALPKPIRRTMTAVGILELLLLMGMLAMGPAGHESSLRIMWQLGKGTLAGLVLLTGCGVLFRKRAGIVLLHAGIGLLLFNELLVGLTAVESRMHIGEGETVNYAENLQRLELAVISHMTPNEDEVVSVSQSRLLSDRLIRHEFLPFDIRVEAFLRNAAIRQAMPNDVNPATSGLGTDWIAHEIPSVSGTDPPGGVNQSAAYVSFLDKQTADVLGTHLVSLQQSEMELPETVTVGEKTYKVSLRFQRSYKPYSVRLVDVRKDDYMGTTIPRNYSSVVQLVDQSRNVDREVRIWMNNPLRFAGETFYQSGYFQDPRSGAESTTLQVVSNTGWMIPYVACMLVAVGMLTHFAITLLRFLNRRERRGLSGDESHSPQIPETAASRNTYLELVLSAAVVIICGGWLFGKSQVPHEAADEFHLYDFGRIPVVYQGRAKPIDTLARNSLRILSDRQTFLDSSGKWQPAVRWLLDLFADPTAAAQHRVFRIEHPEVLQTLGLEARSGFRYAYAELQPRLDDLTKQAELARSLEPERLSVYQKKLLQVSHKITLYELLARSLSAPQLGEPSEDIAGDLLQAEREEQWLAAQSPPLIVPGPQDDGSWQSYYEASLAQRRHETQQGDRASAAPTRLAALNVMRDAYRAGDASRFNEAVHATLAQTAEHPPAGIDHSKIDFEAFFNHFEPFYLCSVLFLFAFVLTAASWLGFSRPLNHAALWLVVLTFAVHSFAVLSRIYISGRPPVTNLYSSAVFIGWGCVLLGIVFERMFRMGLGNIVSSIAGFSTLVIAHFLAGDGDTFVVLQAVLDTQFWLATHVVCITLGYATTLVSGLLGIVYILRGVLTPTLRPESGKALTRMIYGTLCFATLLSFVGTVLGGLWADDSWGRFWGWDPKENGALMIVLWNAVVLHARWGGLVRDRGLAVLAVAGNIAISWSWFGVNELGIGLHSYGFTEGVLRMLGLFVLSQFAIMATGTMPRKWWRSGEYRAA